MLRGHGTLLRDGALVASRCGIVRRVNQLVLTEPLSGGYTPAVGHVVVGRITQVRRAQARVGGVHTMAAYCVAAPLPPFIHAHCHTGLHSWELTLVFLVHPSTVASPLPVRCCR